MSIYFNNALVAMGLKNQEQPQQQPQQKSYSGALNSRVVEVIKNIEPTRFDSVNKAAQVAVVIAGFIPYAFAALAAAIADGAMKTKPALIEAYTALKNKLSKKEELEPEQVSWMNKKTIAAAALLALAAGAYVYLNRETITPDPMSRLYDNVFNPQSSALDPVFGPGNASGIEANKFFNNPLAG